MKDPLRYVWVKKTKACIPINPCESKDEDVRNVYCIPSPATVKNESDAEKVLQRYMEYVMKLHATDIMHIPSSDDKYLIYIGVHTSDTGYYVVRFWRPLGMSLADNMIQAACWAHGKEYIPQKAEEKEFWCSVDNENECQDVADFASLLVGDVVSGYVQRRGTLVCQLKQFN